MGDGQKWVRRGIQYEQPAGWPAAKGVCVPGRRGIVKSLVPENSCRQVVLSAHGLDGGEIVGLII